MAPSVVGLYDVTAVTREFRALFLEQLEATAAQINPVIDAIAMREPSNGSDTTYSFFGSPPTMREWQGDRKLSRLSTESFNLANKDFEASITVKATDIEDNKAGQYGPQIQMLATRAVHHKMQLIADLMANGFAAGGGKSYDGSYFFVDNHPNNGGSVQDNLVTGALSATSLPTAIQALLAMKDDEGVSLRLRPTHLIYDPASNEMTAREILVAAYTAAGATNTLAGYLQPLPVFGIGGKWAVADLSLPIKPFILQERRPPRFISMSGDTDTNVFMRGEHYYGCDWRGNAGYGFWQTIVGSAG
jgi:phage major head subunit gpT-like protein